MSLLTTLTHWLHPDPPPNAAVREAIARIPEVVDTRLRAVGDLEHRLAPAVQHALDYCAALVDQLPAPVNVNSRAFAADPMIHAMFASTDDLAAMLGRSAAVRTFFEAGANPFADECFALLCMRRNQKTTFGMALHGEVLQPEAPRTVIYFSDHVLHGIAPSETETRHKLRWAALRSLLLGFADTLIALRTARDELHAAWQAERAMSHGTLTSDEHVWRQAELERRLGDATAALAPERIVDQLAAWLNAPEERLYLEPCIVSVDRMGVVVPADKADHAETLHCPELISRDRRRWTVTLARISGDEARTAVATEQQRELAMRTLFW